MFTTKPPISFGVKTTFDQFSSDTHLASVESPGVMLRNITRQVASASPRFCKSFKVQFASFGSCSNCGFLGVSSSVIFGEFDKFRPFEGGGWSRNGILEMGFCGVPKDRIFSRNSGGFNGLVSRSYASVAENVEVSSTDCEEEGNEVEELLNELTREDKRVYRRRWKETRCGVAAKENKKLWKRQMRMETEAWVQAVKEYRSLIQEMCDRKLTPNLPYMKTLFLGWFEPLSNKIIEDQESFRLGKTKAPYAPYFDQLPADMLAVITMHKVMGLLMAGGGEGITRVVQAACAIGEAIEQEIMIHNLLTKTEKKKAKKYTRKEEIASDISTNEEEKLRNTVNNLIKKQKLQTARAILKGKDPTKPWTPDAKAQVGSRLLELLLQTAYIQSPVDQLAEGPPDIRPAFVHTFESKKTKKYGVIQCDPIIRSGLDRSVGHMVIPYMPMLVRPVKWTGYNQGAYLFLQSYVMRIHGAKQQREAIKRAPKKQLDFVFEALDTLGNTKWRVHKTVLNVVDKIWNSGGHLADLVDRDDLPLPEQPDTKDEAVLKEWKWKIRKVKKENSERHSLRCALELKLSVARRLKDEEGFFYPHNVDFRGRAYPIHSHLNHLGSDVCRGILEFAEGRPLGKSGLHWLKIHLANLFAGGVDKLSHDGRIAFTESHLDDIFDSADKPLEGRRWWLKAEDPFQCLAVCINISEALRSSSPETTISHIPVHQDGSCNGLQHYAALGRDKLGADAVNLIGGGEPSDVYSSIAARVLKIVKDDAKKNPATFPEALCARNLVNQVDRKLVKQTVMTSVYGVTYIGARDQIKKRLKERGSIEDDIELFRAACYAAKVSLAALGEMFEAARSIMGWLGDCAKIIASENQPVRWITPLGLPVVQPYRIYGKYHVKTSLQGLTLQRETEKVMVKRQRTAFPPNFVHSLDGSHMMMTAVACKKAGLNFAGVHDSYWTHACDVDEMNRILREKFVELYERPILEKLLEGFEKSFPALSFPPLPERGDFELKDVLESLYFFN